MSVRVFLLGEICEQFEQRSFPKAVIRAGGDFMTIEPHFRIDHMSSAETNPKVRKYLIDLHPPGPPYLFGDVAACADLNAFCFKTGDSVTVPTADAAWGGWLCDDFSFLNRNWDTFKDSIKQVRGQSASTFVDMIAALEANKIICFYGENVRSLVPRA